MHNEMVKFSKREKASIVDFFLLLLCIEVLLTSFGFGFNERLGWRYYVLIPVFFITCYFILQYAVKLNKILWEYTDSKPYLYLLGILFVSSCLSFVFTELIFGFENWMFFMYILMIFVTYTVLSSTKLLIVQVYLYKHRQKHLPGTASGNNNTLIVGAGWTGTSLAKEFLNDSSIFRPVCFVDDSYEKKGKTILDLPVAGTVEDMPKVINKYHIKKIIFAIPSCDPERRKQIINLCVSTKCQVKVVPPIQDMVDKSGEGVHELVPQPHDVRIEDLLGREPLSFDFTEVKNNIHDKVVLVTGGGGSIGSELCRQIASFGPKQLIIMEIYENNAYDIQMELKRHYPDLALEAEICSIADYDKCRILFERYKPQLIFHAAAHKHVPLMEHVPEQAIKNNVVGTYNLCKLANEFGVEKFLLISTDKAVNPTNVMGASKRCCEMVVKYHAQISKTTTYCAVRFGNVLGSNGSVIPLFKRQISEGGPITLTDKNIIRYFMTIPEAVSLVLETGTFSQSGEIFVLDMGEPVKILDLAENLIRLSGLEPYKDIDIVFTGLRPGEKLFEELLISGEGMRKTPNKKIFICKQIDVDTKAFIPALNKLISLAKANKSDEVVAQLKVMIPTYHKEPDIHMQ